VRICYFSQCCRSETINFGSVSRSCLPGHYWFGSCSYLITDPFRIHQYFSNFFGIVEMKQFWLIIGKNWTFEVENVVFVNAFLFHLAWSLKILLDPDPDPTVPYLSGHDESGSDCSGLFGSGSGSWKVKSFGSERIRICNTVFFIIRIIHGVVLFRV